MREANVFVNVCACAFRLKEKNLGESLIARGSMCFDVSVNAKRKQESREKNQGLCFASVKVSDSLLILYYYKELCSPHMNPRDHCSPNQTKDRNKVYLLLHIYPSISVWFRSHGVIVKQHHKKFSHCCKSA